MTEKKAHKLNYFVKPTSQSIQQLLPKFLKTLTHACGQRPDLLLAAWPEIIGERLAPMALADRFDEGTLYVKVSNSTLLSILSYREKKLLLKKMKEKFPKIDIKEIRFRIG